MPHLIAFAPCRRPSIDKDDSLVSLSAIFTSLNVLIGDQGLPPAGTIIPFEWGLGAVLIEQDADTGKSFDITFRVVSPSGKVIHDSSTSLDLKLGSFSSSMKFNDFCIDEEGDVMVMCCLTEDGNETVIAEHPIRVRYIVQ